KCGFGLWIGNERQRFFRERIGEHWQRQLGLGFGLWIGNEWQRFFRERIGEHWQRQLWLWLERFGIGWQR
ncbi:MAG: hypothetical protein ACLGXA_07650, partial [Acidobacteriota bacterium]